MSAPRWETVALGCALLSALLLSGCTAGAPEPTAPETAPESSLLEVSGTSRPTVAWDPVDGAERYRLIVVQADGPEWAWEGTATSVVLGGGQVEDRLGPGFALVGDATLLFQALGPEGEPILLEESTLPG